MRTVESFGVVTENDGQAVGVDLVLTFDLGASQQSRISEKIIRVHSAATFAFKTYLIRIVGSVQMPGKNVEYRLLPSTSGRRSTKRAPLRRRNVGVRAPGDGPAGRTWGATPQGRVAVHVGRRFRGGPVRLPLSRQPAIGSSFRPARPTRPPTRPGGPGAWQRPSIWIIKGYLASSCGRAGRGARSGAQPG